MADKKVGFQDEAGHFNTFRFTLEDLSHMDGVWRQILHSWLAENVLYGEYIPWGSNNTINTTITMDQLQELVMRVAVAVLNQNKTGE